MRSKVQNNKFNKKQNQYGMKQNEKEEEQHVVLTLFNQNVTS